MTLIQTAFIEIFSEAFDGIKPGADGTWFVQGKEGFFDAIDNLSAEQASKALAPGVSTIAAHTDHTRYYIELTNKNIREENPVADWDGSWENQTVDEETWQRVKAGLRKEVDWLLAYVAETGPENEEDMIGTLASVAHAAYHLGAVRQLLTLANASD